MTVSERRCDAARTTIENACVTRAEQKQKRRSPPVLQKIRKLLNIELTDRRRRKMGTWGTVSKPTHDRTEEKNRIECAAIQSFLHYRKWPASSKSHTHGLIAVRPEARLEITCSQQRMTSAALESNEEMRETDDDSNCSHARRRWRMNEWSEIDTCQFMTDRRASRRCDDAHRTRASHMDEWTRSERRDDNIIKKII